MIDFKKRLGKKAVEKPVDPIEIYEKLDRASDKGPLRPVQQEVLNEWHTSYRDKRDVILKLNTGQGKTLIGLVMLQSWLNQGEGPVLYLCPNKFLVNQTVNEGAQFGIRCVTSDDELPDEFLDNRAILIAPVHKLFNGLSKFRLAPHSLSVPTILMDDSHTCIEAIRDSCVIRLKHTETAYSEILTLFDHSLKAQGAGTYADIKRSQYEGLLPVPYWDWFDRHVEVSEILSKHSSNDAIKFAWPLLKDIIKDCLCIISGTSLEISPYLPPLHIFGTYHNARRRIFMSASVADDSLLVKGLGLSEDTLHDPLVSKQEKWSGERMVLIPSLIDSELSREKIVELLAKPKPKRKVGVVGLCPRFASCKDWEAYGATVATTNNIDSQVSALRNKSYDKTVVFVNRYDGIDLPDDACRILLLDGKPHPETLTDRYIETCRASSEVIATKTARTIEQGMGRAVRGEKDYCVLILIGPDLIKAIRTREGRKYFSNQTQMQMDIGMEVADLAKDELGGGVDPKTVLSDLINQCLKRDEGWKEYYTDKMSELAPGPTPPRIVHIFATERRAEQAYLDGEYDKAVGILQDLINKHITDKSEKGWYLQESARYLYPKSKSQSNDLQVSAHRMNRFLLKPKTGMAFTTVSLSGQKRIENLLSWIRGFAGVEELILTVEEILGNLRFGVEADIFEKAFDDLGKALGFECQRPDKEWKEGPDNLWALKDGQYLLVECKSYASLNRAEVYKHETGEMNNHCAWFDKHYGGCQVKRVMIVPTLKLAKGAGFNQQVVAMRNVGLQRLVSNVNAFFNEFKSLDIKDLSEAKIHELLNIHQLRVEDLTEKYTETFKGK